MTILSLGAGRSDAAALIFDTFGQQHRVAPAAAVLLRNVLLVIL
jgi:hypothetical protein